MRLLPNIIKTQDYFISPPKNEYEKQGQRIIEKAKKQADEIQKDAEKNVGTSSRNKATI